MENSNLYAVKLENGEQRLVIAKSIKEIEGIVGAVATEVQLIANCTDNSCVFKPLF